MLMLYAAPAHFTRLFSKWTGNEKQAALLVLLVIPAHHARLPLW
jgi:hypothetical protein